MNKELLCDTCIHGQLCMNREKFLTYHKNVENVVNPEPESFVVEASCKYYMRGQHVMYTKRELTQAKFT